MTFIQNLKKYKYLIVTILIIVLGLAQRLDHAWHTSLGGDAQTHLRAVTELFSGVNPYAWTVETYKNLENDPGNKGYAYLPGIMYMNSAFYLFHLALKYSFGINLHLPFLFLLPSVISSLFIGIFFIKYFYNKNQLAMLFCNIAWFFNSYFVAQKNDVGYDAVAVALLLWALHFLEKDDVKSSALFSLAVIVKTFPIVLLPIFLMKSKNKLLFVVTGIIMFLSFSVPFLTSKSDFLTYIQGALLVHGDRFVQGRPFLYYLSYYEKIELFRIIPFKFYSLGSILIGWVISIVLRTFNVIKDKYELSVFPIVVFLVLTPVLNRSYLVWGIPLILVGTYSFFQQRHSRLFYSINIFVWVFFYWYLLQWKDGFHIWHP